MRWLASLPRTFGRRGLGVDAVFYLLLLSALAGAQPDAPRSIGSARVGGPRLEDGTEVDCDFPASQQMKNEGGSDGAGLCVFDSTNWAANYAGHFPLGDVQRGIFRWMKKHPGGGYPSKLAKMMKQYCAEMGIAEPEWLQVESDDLDVVAKLVQGNHLVGVTYCRSPTGRYGGRRIAHMLCCVAARAGPQKLWGIVDNNYIGTVEWMTEEQFRVAYTGYGGGWCVAFKRPGPPLPPRSQR